MWVDSVPVGEGRHRLLWLDANHEVGRHFIPVSPEFDYRITFDRDRELWRLDVRTHVEGG